MSGRLCGDGRGLRVGNHRNPRPLRTVFGKQIYQTLIERREPAALVQCYSQEIGIRDLLMPDQLPPELANGVIEAACPSAKRRV